MRFTFGLGAQRDAQSLVPPPIESRKPLVAVALSAGAARGWSQIGVLRALISAGVVPDIVVGTSMGAVVGGCYCAGRLDDVADFALSLTKRRVFGFMDFTMSGMGLLSGNRLKAMLARDMGDVRIEDLPARFACVATEVGSGHEIWLTRGNLVEALRASYALPGIFEPVRIDSRWLIDGALVNPIPVSVCRALGADIVIAVNLVVETITHQVASGPPSAFEAELVSDLQVQLSGRFLGSWRTARPSANGPKPMTHGPSMAKVLVDAFNITQDRIARSRLAGDPPDLTINVKVGRFGLFDFHRAAELIAVGHEAVRRSQADLSELLETARPSPVTKI